MLSECYRCSYVCIPVHCAFLAVNFAGGSTAVLFDEVLKWVSFSVVLRLSQRSMGDKNKMYSQENSAATIAVTRHISVPGEHGPAKK